MKTLSSCALAATAVISAISMIACSSSSSAVDAGHASTSMDTGHPVDTGGSSSSSSSTRASSSQETGVDAGHDATLVDATESDAAGEAATDAAPSKDAEADDAHGDARDATGDGGQDASDGGGGTIIPLVTTPQALSFGTAAGMAGYVACGTSPTKQTLSLINEGTTTLQWWTGFALGAGTPYTLSRNCTMATPCTIAANQTINVVVTGQAVPTDGGLENLDDTLTIYSSAPGDLGTPVTLTEKAYGAVIKVSPGSEPFGAQVENGMYDKTVTVTNTGNATYGLKFVVTGDAGEKEFSTSPTTLSVPTTGSMFNVVFTPGTSTAAAKATIVLAAVPDGGPLCATLPTVAVSGSGTP